MPERYERVRVGWHCAKVKGHAELKIEKSRVKTFIYDFPKLSHSNPNSFGVNVHLCQFKKKPVKAIERSRDVTPRSKYEKLKGTQGPPVLQIWCNSDYYFRSAPFVQQLKCAKKSRRKERPETPGQKQNVSPYYADM